MKYRPYPGDRVLVTFQSEMGYPGLCDRPKRKGWVQSVRVKFARTESEYFIAAVLLDKPFYSERLWYAPVGWCKIVKEKIK